ncbi:MAG: polyprenyl synthetase family protein [Actinomycetota bacterium]|nr:polyprenyl synthetase family protein [Actinomycetota bacterium]
MEPTHLPSTGEVRRLVNETLEAFLGEKAREVLPGDERRLVEEVTRVVSAGGKRLRPAFCYWGYRAAGGAETEAIVRLAASLELLHTFAIVHDDVMDSSALRRGEPTVHRRFADEERSIRGDRDHFGESAAILVGDLAFVLADELFLSSGFVHDRLAAAMSWFTSMRREVIRGQYLDLLAASRGQTGSAVARRIAALKSGGYTVEKPLLIGAAVAGAPEPLLDSLTLYGAPLGEAFQLRDDILGVFGDPKETGKDADGDLLEGKQTYLIAVARERAAPEDRALLEDRLGRRDLSQEDVERLRVILRDTGALQETTRLIDELTARALEAAATFPADVAEALAALADEASERLY